MLQDIRAFFAGEGVLEVETPVLSRAGITDPHLHSFTSRWRDTPLYLHTSPEFFMKRLLADGSGDIYQVARVFRDDEQGRFHNPEFTLLEWYRLGFDHHRLMDDVQALLQSLSLASNLSTAMQRRSYRQCFLEVLGIDPLDASAGALKDVTRDHDIDVPVGMGEDDPDMWLDWLMTQAIAPSFEGFTFVYDYPASQAALAALDGDDPRVANRFELFYGELELANGFRELTDAPQQRRRFEGENHLRRQRGLPQIPLDEHLLQALEHGLPACAGVALGLDRLLMLVTGADTISAVLGFDFDCC